MIRGLKNVALTVLLAACSVPCHAYVVDGLLGDWGVNPFSDWTPSSASADWAGTAGEENWGSAQNTPNPPTSLGQEYDTEALYLDDDPFNIYFALVTSVPQGAVNPLSGSPVQTGDLAVALKADGKGGYDYGIRLGQGSDFGSAFYLPTWNFSDGNFGSLSFTGGTNLGYAVLATTKTVAEDGSQIIVTEGSIPKELLDNPGEDNPIVLSVNPPGGDEILTVNRDIDNPVPEPATLLLVGTGLIGVIGLGKKKLR